VMSSMIDREAECELQGERSARFRRFLQRNGRQLPIAAKPWCFQGGGQHFQIASDEARSRNPAIPCRRACCPGERCRRDRNSRTRGACAGGLGVGGPHLGRDDPGCWRCLVGGASASRYVGGPRDSVFCAQPANRGRMARSSLSDRVHAEPGWRNSRDPVEIKADGRADPPCPSRAQTTMTAAS
jgi:hypothetical protein